MDLSKLPIAWQFLAAGLIAAIAFADKLAPLGAQLLKRLLPDQIRPVAPLPDLLEPPTDEDAYRAAKTLIAYFEREKCQAGLQAAREAGRHLFHDRASEEVLP